jgi:hypothetical protein
VDVRERANDEGCRVQAVKTGVGTTWLKGGNDLATRILR